MKLFRGGRLLFRTYLIIVGGLVATAAVFDYGFGRLQASAEPPRDPWAEASLALIEARLLAATVDQRPTVAQSLERELGFPVRLLADGAVVHAGNSTPAATREVFDDAGRSTFLRSSAALGASIQVGPVGADEPQSGWLTRGLDPSLKSVRVANYIVTLRKELLALSRACGVAHPSLVTPHQIEILDGRFGARTVADLLGGRGRGVAFDDDPELPLASRL